MVINSDYASDAFLTFDDCYGIRVHYAEDFLLSMISSRRDGSRLNVLDGPTSNPPHATEHTKHPFEPLGLRWLKAFHPHGTVVPDPCGAHDIIAPSACLMLRAIVVNTSYCIGHVSAQVR